MCRKLVFVVVMQLVLAGTNAYFIDVLESRNSTNEARSLQQEAVNEMNYHLTANGSPLTLRLKNDSRKTDVYKNGYSLLTSDVIGIFSLDPDPITECILSNISGIPIFRLHDQDTTKLKQFGFCKHLLTMSANSVSYAEATDRILSSFQWRKLAVIFEGHRLYQTVYFQALAAKRDYQITYIQMADETNKTTFDMAKKVMKTLVASDVDVILLYVRDSYKSLLLEMETCNPKKSYVWIIQDSITKYMKSYPDHMVVGFHLPRNIFSSQPKKTIIPWITEDSINLLYDAKSVVSKAIDKLLQTGVWLPGNDTSSLLSNKKKLNEQAVKTIVSGRTGLIKFDAFGQRLVEQLSIVNLRNGVFVKIGTWLRNSSKLRLDDEIRENNYQRKHFGMLQGRKLSVTTMAIEPFVFKTILSDGTVKYTGFLIDLLQQLASDLKFTYDIHEPPDLQYGYVKNGSWNGMIREIMDGKADMIVADITITGERESVVDFTVGYTYYREDMVMRKTPIERIDFVQFMSPFSVGVWLMLLGSFLLVSLALFVLNYFSPYGHKNDQGTRTADEFRFLNCFWFSIACMLQQGADHLPKALSGRILVGVFWFSIVIWVSTYTANLAAFFTVNNFVFPITSFTQAVESSDYEIGLSRKSHLYRFFETSQVELYKKAWKRMENIPNDNPTGVRWARERQYIHIANGPLLEYELSKPPCDLIMIPGLETPKSYGFAMKSNDPHLHQISLGILHLRDYGFIDNLKKKYWKGSGKCTTEDSTKITRSTIQLSSMAGVFVVLAVGCLISVITLAIETWWYQNNAGIREKVDTLTKGKFSLGFARKFATKRNNDLHMGKVNQGVGGEE